MNRIYRLFPLLLLLLLTPATGFCSGDHHGHHEEEEEEHHPEGPRGGRLLTSDELSVEILIEEEGVPPEFHIYFYHHDELIPPKEVDFELSTKRLGEDFVVIPFEEVGDYLRSTVTVYEPHSFSVKAIARYGKHKHQWQYDSFEGRVELSDAAIKAADFTFLQAEPRKIAVSIELNGRISANNDRTAHITPRFPGIVKQVSRAIGEEVAAGDLLAKIESNQSLQTYEVRSLIAGTIVNKHVSLGEFVNEEQTIFIISDLQEVWADFAIFPGHFQSVKKGQSISIYPYGSSEGIDSVVSYISAYSDPITQSKTLRAVLPNKENSLPPGLFASARVVTETRPVELTVKKTAIQALNDFTVVFVKEGNTFEARPITTGIEDDEYIEILSGLKKGQKYVHENNYLLKAEILKSGAAHHH